MAKLDISEIQALSARVKAVGKLHGAVGRAVHDKAKELGVDASMLWAALFVYNPEQSQPKARR